MRGVLFNADVKRYALTMAMGKINRKLHYSSWSCTTYRQDLDTPPLPSQRWVRVKSRMAGICGSDLNLIFLHDSPSASPFISSPFVIGHENVGVIDEVGGQAQGVQKGQRVVVDPVLGCEVRGLRPCKNCAEGKPELCLNFTQGDISSGMLTGFCKDTAGSWGDYYVAHESQLIRVPDSVDDASAVMTDPVASALHPVLSNRPMDDDHVLVVGAGVIGLMVVACLRAIGSRCKITVMARHAFQRDLALYYGADHVVSGRGDYFGELARVVDGTLLKPIIGKRIMQGGFQVVYDCVGSSTSIDESMRFTAESGRLVLVGLAAVPKGVDWTPVWLKELTIKGAYCYGYDLHEGKTVRTYQMALDLIASGAIDVKPCITHRFPLEEYRKAIEVASNKKEHKSVKVLLEVS